MSELTEKTEVTVQTEQAEKAEKSEKPRTLNSVRRELQRLEKSKEEKKKKIKTLTEEIKAENAKIKELETVYDELYHEDLQKQISNAWFKKGGLSGGQIEKILQLSKEIKDKIDILDVDTVVQAVNTAYEQKQNGQPSNAETKGLTPVLPSVSDESEEQNFAAIKPVNPYTPETRNKVMT
ncbi:MAG: hypothetical protein IJJ69_06845 [Oscillospiraceae bacterium]|nr:hypothetical protein [Oscillospiraceae bacterium]